ncbi:MAG: DUF11 domain-containing protein, partial [Actinobacteria bacterium]|nr:DUF11 domain-containing protein [Actinomycetota bacterium]
MIGNTNMTLQSYSPEGQNGLSTMIYVDIDGNTNTLNSSSANLTFSTENGAIPANSTILFAGLYWTGRAHDGTSPNTFTVTKGTVTKNYDKSVVYLRHANAAGYTQINATDLNFKQDIYYPTSTDGSMYSAYADVTNYVKQNGLGEYFVADIACREGNGGGAGFYGGWGMVVVYSNPLMSWRDVTVFDGHAFIAADVVGTFKSYDLGVSGFQTAASGQINMKLGMMAGEGDRPIAGDQFLIRNVANSWVNLNHSLNSTTNFFNSSVNTGGNTRNPNLVNNTGVDIAMFNLPNTNNSLITNGQTSTTFRYGTTQDTYVIFCIVMSVDAQPAIEVTKTATVTDKNDNKLNDAGDVINYTITVENIGTVILTDVVVEDPLTEFSQTISTLEPGSSNALTYTTTYTITQADVDKGDKINNTATATYIYGGEERGSSDSESVPVGQAPSLSLVKTGMLNDLDEDGLADVGETITYSFTVTNTGNVTLTNVTVTDLLVTVSGGPTTLDVGETDNTTFTATYTITQADIDAGKVDNIATADSYESDPATDDETVLLAQDASIALTKTATLINGELADPIVYDAVGDVITYTIVVTNTGNVTLTDVEVTDPLTELSATIETL